MTFPQRLFRPEYALVEEFLFAHDVYVYAVLVGDDRDKEKHWIISTLGKCQQVPFIVCKMF